MTGGCLQVIFDDGSIPDLSALANIKTVNGPLIVWGTGSAALSDLTGLEGITVSIHWACARRLLVGKGCGLGLTVCHVFKKSSSAHLAHWCV
jgi:hypothetical protein